MYCPEHLVFKSRFLWVWMYWRDVPRERIPLRIWLNPLRYEVRVHAFRWNLLVVNREGAWARRFSNWIHRLRHGATP